MIPLPASLAVKRNKTSEAGLVTKAREWIEGDNRTPGLHASDVLDERLGFFNHTDPRKLPDRLVNMFLVGKVLHAFVLHSVDGTGPVDLGATDGGSSISNDLGISYSPDKILRGRIVELKTSRSFYEPKDVEKDLGLYIEQLLVYMAAERHTRSQLWILYLNFKEDGKTSPQFRAYDIAISEDDLASITTYIRERVDALRDAIERHDPTALALCRPWKCGRGNCDYYDACKPSGRWGTKQFDGRVDAAARKQSGRAVSEASEVSGPAETDEGL